MALGLLIYQEGFQPFDTLRTIARIEALPGVRECSYENGSDAVFECSYSDPAANDGGYTKITLLRDANAIGMGRAEIHAVGFAFALQSESEARLHLINSNYDFDLRIADFSSAAELLAATDAELR